MSTTRIFSIIRLMCREVKKGIKVAEGYFIVNCERIVTMNRFKSIQNRMHSTNKIKPLSTLSDSALMEKLQGGQTEKLGLLFERYHKRLFGFFMKLTRGKQALSEDLVQNTFFRVLKYKKSYKPDKKFSTWIYQIGRNVFYDQCKKKSNNEYSVDEFTFNEPSTKMESPFEEIDERKIILQQALDELPDDKREIIVLSRYEGLKYKEIGDILDCTENAVKVKAHRALKELKQRYSQIEKNLAI